MPVNIPRGTDEKRQSSTLSTFIFANTGEFNTGLVDESGDPIKYTRSDVSLVPHYRIAPGIKNNFQYKSVVSLNELFVPYTSENYEDYRQSYLNISRADASGYDIIDDERLYDAITYSRPYHYASGMNYGIIPTFGEELTSTSGIIDNTDSSGVRGIGLRFPIIVGGFGHDSEGLPFPNKFERRLFNDTEESGYESTIYNAIPSTQTDYIDSRSFDDNYNKDERKMVSGFIDLRYNRYKRMWDCGPRYYEGYSLDNVVPPSGRYTGQTFTSGEMVLYYGRYEGWSRPRETTKVMFINRSISLNIYSGSYLVCAEMPNGELRPIFSDCEADLPPDGIEPAYDIPFSGYPVGVWGGPDS